VFARGSKPDGTEVVALNVSCIDGIELAKLTMTPVAWAESLGLVAPQARSYLSDRERSFAARSAF